MQLNGASTLYIGKRFQNQGYSSNDWEFYDRSSLTGCKSFSCCSGSQCCTDVTCPPQTPCTPVTCPPATKGHTKGPPTECTPVTCPTTCTPTICPPQGKSQLGNPLKYSNFLKPFLFRSRLRHGPGLYHPLL